MSAAHPDQVEGGLLCRFDETKHPSVEALHAHLKRFRCSRERYYQTYHARHDKVTNELIPFKDLDQYLSTDFVSKITLKRWLKENPAEGWVWSKEWLARRKREKGLVYAPSQTELRTLSCPSIPYYDKVGEAEGGYHGVAAALGFTPRYEAAPPNPPPLPTDAIILQDTREQTPIRFARGSVVQTLKVGDYALASPHDVGVRIERKSLSDFCGTMSGRRVDHTNKAGRVTRTDSQYQRFERELERAAEGDLYVVMLVEASITDAQRFDYLPQTKWLKASPSYVFHQLRDLLIRYPLTFQCAFVDGRSEMERAILNVLAMGEQVRKVDVQYALEGGKL